MDVAEKVWGEGWCMPTRFEFIELCTKCSWEEVTMSGVKGMKAVASNGNSIFFPTGVFKEYTEHGFDDDAGGYWSKAQDGSEWQSNRRG